MLKFWIQCQICSYTFLHKISTPITCPICDSGRFRILLEKHPVRKEEMNENQVAQGGRS